MSKKLQKIVSITTSVATIAWVSGIGMLAPIAANAVVGSVPEGALIRVANTLDVYIAKYVGAKAFKRLILSPSVFNSYQHLSWNNIMTVSQATMDQFTISTLVRAVGDPKVYNLAPVANSDSGGKHWVNMAAEQFGNCKLTNTLFDWDSVYTINTVDRDSYTASTDDTTCTLSTEVTPPVVSGAVTVSLASDTPAAGVAPLKAIRVPFTKIAFTAGSADATITSLTVQRTGLSDDLALSSIALIDNATNLQVGLNQTLNASQQVIFRDTITIPANTTKYYTLAANMRTTAATSYAGQIAALSLVSVTANGTVGGTLPITGNGQTINETLSIGTYSGVAGSLNAATSTKEVGTTNYNFSAIKVTAGSAEDITIYSVRFNQSGSAAASDLANVVVSDGTTNYSTTVSSDGKYYTASFGSAGIVVAKGLSKEFTLKADIVSGSARTIKFDIYRATDIVIKGNTYGYYLTIDTNTAGAFNTAINPIFMGSTITVGTGSLRVDKNTALAPAANVMKGGTGVILGAFDFVVQGEAVNVSSIALTVTTTTIAHAGAATNYTLSKSDGTIIAGPVNYAFVSAGVGTVTFSTTVSFPVGTTPLLVKANLNSGWETDDTVVMSLTPSTAVTSITGSITGNTITATPATSISSNAMVVKGGSLAVSVAGTPVQQTVVRGINGFVFANYVFDASASGEDVKVTVVQLQDIVGANGAESYLTTPQLFDGTTALNTGSNVPTLAGAAGAGATQTTFTLDSGLVIPKGTSKTIVFKANISGSTPSGSQYQWGLKASPTITATGVSTTQTIAASGVTSAQNGQQMTISVGGSYSAVLDSSTPTARMIPANSTGVIMTQLRFKATSEPINVTKVTLALTNASSTTNDIIKIYIMDGSTELASGALGTGNANGLTSANATSTFTLNPVLQLGVNQEKVVTIKADIAAISTISSVAYPGHNLVIDYYGSTDTSKDAGTGQSSGSTLNYSLSTNNSSNPCYIFRSTPTVALVALPNTTLSNGTFTIGKFSVTAASAPAGGDVDLYKFDFKIATTSGSSGQLGISNLTLVDVTSAEVILYASTTGYYADTWGSGVNPAAKGSIATSTVEVILLASPGTPDTSRPTARTISAGTPRTFELRATITGVSTGASVTTSLQGDAAIPTAFSAGSLGTLLGTSTVQADVNNDFVWSDWSASSHSTGATGGATSDWTNGYLVGGLPSSQLAAQTASK